MNPDLGNTVMNECSSYLHIDRRVQIVHLKNRMGNVKNSD